MQPEPQKESNADVPTPTPTPTPTPLDTNNVFFEKPVQQSQESTEIQPVESTEIQPVEPTTPTTDFSSFGGGDHPSFESTPPVIVQPLTKKSRKKLIILSAIAAVIIVLAGSGVAFALWFTSPDKVVSDAVRNALEAKTSISEGSISYKDTASETEVTFAFTGKADRAKLTSQLDADVTIKTADTSYNLKGSGLVSNSGAVYLRVQNAQKIVNDTLGGSIGSYFGKALKTSVQNFVKKIDNKWIKIDKSDIDQYTKANDKQQACVKSVASNFDKNDAQKKEVFEAYDKNRFLQLSNSSGSDSIDGVDSAAYALNFNVSKSEDFGIALQKTTAFKALVDCSKKPGDKDISTTKSSASDLESSQKEADSLKTTLWVSRWSHELTQVQIKRDKDGTVFDAHVKFKTNQPLDLKDIDGALPLSQVVKDFQDIITKYEAETSSSSLYNDTNTIDFGVKTL